MVNLYRSFKTLGMTIVFIRHSDDEGHHCSRLHDCELNPNGENLAMRVGRQIIDEYGIPDIVYCSPFRRTIQTMENMLYGVDMDDIDVRVDPMLMRYFARNEKRRPDIAPQTRGCEKYINESYNGFKRRVDRFIRKIERYERSKKLVFVVTHTLVYIRIGRLYHASLPRYIPFMSHIVVE